MSELAWFLVPPCAALWMAGGTWWKPLRRYAYSLVLGGGLAWAGAYWFDAFLLGLFISLVTHFGYGDGATWVIRCGIACAYALSLLPVVSWPDAAASVLILASAVLFVGSLWLSRKLDRDFPHKLVELLHGGWFAGMAVWLASR